MTMNLKRSSGILMPISSLPSQYGIGTLGEAAFRFADFLKSAGQTCWQLLPLGPTGYGDSPYSSFSAYAGNPYFIDLGCLCRDGLLEMGDIDGVDWGNDPRNVDYGKIYARRWEVLRKAFRAGWPRDRQAVLAFAEENGRWLPDYALFMALKQHFGMRPWTYWADKDIRTRHPESMARYQALLEDDMRFFTYLQFLFFRQWHTLREYAGSRGIRLIGDLPMYVAPDSADVWAEPENFLLDEQNLPREVSGVPPDRFSADGQLWGNPIYDWQRMREDGYSWWIRRIAGSKRLYDILRIDHFRGLESYWSVPYGAKTSKAGRWVKGPGMDFVRIIRDWFAGVPIIAEDLGLMTPEVGQLMAESGFPGMKVLAFAFGDGEASGYLPHNYGHNCVCYVGTHDNETIIQWWDTADRRDVAFARRYLAIHDDEGFNWGVIRGGMSSVADLFVVQMQDCLGLGGEARMNIPGTETGNWRWRLLPGEADDVLAAKLYEYTKMYGRCE